MKQILWMCSVLTTSFLYTHWKIGTITKPADLEIDSAWYIKPKNQPKQITGLSSKLVSQRGQNTIEINHKVGDKTGECSYIIARSKVGKKYKISFDGPSVYAVHSGRAKTKTGNRAGVGKKEIDVHKYDYMARVFLYGLDESGNENPLTHAVKGFVLENSDPITLDIEILDKNNLYSVVFN